MNNRLVISSTIGFMCIGFTSWMHGLGLSHWVAGPNMLAMVMAFTLGTVVLGIIAILSFFHGRTLEAIIFFGFAGFIFTIAHHGGMDHMGMGQDSSGTMGWFLLIWAVFFFYVWLASFKAGRARSLFLLALWLAILAACLAQWLGWEGFSYIHGYLALFTGLVATYISAATIINHGCGKTCLPGNPSDAS
jgi:succinate-acetate transporter protein